jgi:hypothetical protein
MGEMTDWAGGLQFPGIHSSSRDMIVDWPFPCFYLFFLFNLFFQFPSYPVSIWRQKPYKCICIKK